LKIFDCIYLGAHLCVSVCACERSLLQCCCDFRPHWAGVRHTHSESLSLCRSAEPQHRPPDWDVADHHDLLQDDGWQERHAFTRWTRY